MYEIYCDWLIEHYNDALPVSESFYRHIFNSQFNLGFAPPMSETCNFCDWTKQELQTLSEDTDMEQISRLKAEKMLHERRAKMAQTLQKEMTGNQDPTVAAISINMQQAFPTPSTINRNYGLIILEFTILKPEIHLCSFGMRALQNEGLLKFQVAPCIT
ncbi:hypothetical protein L9F63_023583 [Diploptera punctata]|uniref:Uncharacterized protein n=1 Tax=Diploptera punctata TaxID=6984 RepID=A0AAD7ZIV3_DIPPU|nr:hypothetical protein L9F63_023583 [Diploptera punctata]